MRVLILFTGIVRRHVKHMHVTPSAADAKGKISSFGRILLNRPLPRSQTAACGSSIPGYKPANEEPSEYQTIPLNKIEDFGVHFNQYYSLDVTYFKSSLDRRLLDSLWNKYWVNTLSSSSLLTTADYTTGQIFDLSDKPDPIRSGRRTEGDKLDRGRSK